MTYATIILKYFITIFCSFILYFKILNLDVKKLNAFKIIIFLLYSALMSLIMHLLRMRMPEISVAFMIISSCILVRFFIALPFEVAISAMFLSYAINYVVLTVIFFIDSSVAVFISGENLPDLYILIICFFLQPVLISLFFSTKRFKNGFPFLYNQNTRTIGLSASAIIIVNFVLLSRSEDVTSNKFFPLVLATINAAFVFIWWRNSLTKTYSEKLRENEINTANEALRKKDKEMKNLIKHNDFLSGIIHRDNKLIPSMEFAVREYLKGSFGKSPEEIRKIGKELAMQMQSEMSDRKGIIKNYISKNHVLQKTNISSTDNILAYMAQRAEEDDIFMDVLVFGNIKYMAAELISEENLNTILADLTENAIIAVRNCAHKKITVSLGIVNDKYELSVEDSGQHFKKEILHNLGKAKITSHKDSGGSGIGMITVFDILKQTGASLIITEYAAVPQKPSKKICVRFDGQNRFEVNEQTDGKQPEELEKTHIYSHSIK